MSTGTCFKRIKRRFKRKLYKFLLALNDFDFSRLRPLCYLLIIAGMLLAWSKLPTTETASTASSHAIAAGSLASAVRSATAAQENLSVDIVALFLPQEASAETLSSALSSETLYSFYLTGKELSYLAEGAVTTVSKDNRLYLDGLNFTYHKNRLPFNRVTALSSVSGEEIISNRLYHIVSTEDIFALFHYISYRSLGIMSIYPKDATGSLLSDYQKVMFTEAGAPFTVQAALSFGEAVPATADSTPSIVIIQKGFNLIDLIKEPNRITICVCALFIAFFALLWYIVPRINRIHVWFRIYRIRTKKRSTNHALYELKKRF